MSRRRRAHGAGDHDLRIESQANTVYGLSLAYEEFDVDYDNTTIDQEHRRVELHRPDGKPDILQPVEHGCLSIVGGYRALGRLYRGIICPTLRQYTILGDPVNQTDGEHFEVPLRTDEAPPVGLPASADDREHAQSLVSSRRTSGSKPSTSSETARPVT